MGKQFYNKSTIYEKHVATEKKNQGTAERRTVFTPRHRLNRKKRFLKLIKK